LRASGLSLKSARRSGKDADRVPSLDHSDRFVATTEFYVRYAETDAQGIVHHASYLIWMEEARSHFARIMVHDYAEFERSGYFMGVTDVSVRYRAASRYGDLIAVRCWVADVKSRAVAFEYEIAHANHDTLYATARSEHICLTRDGKISLWPEEWRKWLGELAE
jgi:acyl-CoA thioester hydrolase